MVRQSRSNVLNINGRYFGKVYQCTRMVELPNDRSAGWTVSLKPDLCSYIFTMIKGAFPSNRTQPLTKCPLPFLSVSGNVGFV